MPIDHIRLSQHAKDQLIKLKRDTGIMQWNVLCRWAFCVSLAEPSTPPDAQIPADSNVEMDWKTFGGEYADVYWALLKELCHERGLPEDNQHLHALLRLHIHRGIFYLGSMPFPLGVASLAALKRFEETQT